MTIVCREIWAAAAADIIAPCQLIPAAADPRLIRTVLTKQASILKAIRAAKPKGVLLSGLPSCHVPVWPPWSPSDGTGSRFLATHGPGGHLIVLDCQAGVGLHLTSPRFFAPEEVAKEISAATAWEWIGPDLLVSSAKMPGPVQAFHVRGMQAAMHGTAAPSLMWPGEGDSHSSVCVRVSNLWNRAAALIILLASNDCISAMSLVLITQPCSLLIPSVAMAV